MSHADKVAWVARKGRCYSSYVDLTKRRAGLLLLAGCSNSRLGASAREKLSVGWEWPIH
jgi:hypothetical protein